MRILYISQYFPPEVGATQTRAHEMAIYLARQGHQVVVLTEFPNHPKGIIPPEYRGRLVEHTKMDGFDVVRVFVYTSPKKNFATRMGFYLSFMFIAALVGSFLRGRFDVVYATSPPFFVGLAGVWLSRIKGARFVLEIRDLWPQTAVELGELKNERFIRWSEKLEMFYYRKADCIVAVTKGIYQNLVNRVGADKVRLIPNGANTDLFYYRGDAVKQKLGLHDKFVVLYAGIFGIAQGMEQLCELVQSMKSDDSIHFVFIGEGPLKQQVEDIRQKKSLTNLTILDEIAREEIPAYISAADCCLVPLKKNPLFLGALPSKMFDFMACERPVIVSVDGEARRVVQESGAGIFVEPENTLQMAEAIRKLKETPELVIKMGKAGRQYVARNFSRKMNAQRLEKLLQEMLAAG